MPSTTNASAEAAVENLPAVPLTIEGASVLHQMMRVRWTAWKCVPVAHRVEIVREAADALAEMERNPSGQSAAFSLLGHKGDLIIVHFRQSFVELGQVERHIAQLRLADYLEPTGSYLSVVELGLYESSLKTYSSLQARGIAPFSPEWSAELEEVLARSREAMRPRLFPEIPPHKYICFYPMDRKRGEAKNWYQLPMAERQRQMHEHGMIGRRYAGDVKQIISGSIGFADDPLVFRTLISEMRFDEVSAVYALFGTFYVGIRRPAAELAQWLAV